MNKQPKVHRFVKSLEGSETNLVDNCIRCGDPLYEAHVMPDLYATGICADCWLKEDNDDE